VWDATTSAPIGDRLQHEGRVFSAYFSPDGTRVVTASVDNTARVWTTPIWPPNMLIGYAPVSTVDQTTVQARGLFAARAIGGRGGVTARKIGA
jgi:WD40 repeat protein